MKQFAIDCVHLVLSLEVNELQEEQNQHQILLINLKLLKKKWMWK
jgi:hypothetical protein